MCHRQVFEALDESPATGIVSKKEFKSALKTIYQGAGRRGGGAFEDWLDEQDWAALTEALARKGGSIPYDDFLSVAVDAKEESDVVVEVRPYLRNEPLSHPYLAPI